MTGVQTCALPICFPVTIGSVWEVKQEMFKGWTGFINTANQLWDQMIKWQPTEKTTIDHKEVEIPKYFDFEVYAFEFFFFFLAFSK